jgi:hypothetical protein
MHRLTILRISVFCFSLGILSACSAEQLALVAQLKSLPSNLPSSIPSSIPSATPSVTFSPKPTPENNTGSTPEPTPISSPSALLATSIPTPLPTPVATAVATPSPMPIPSITPTASVTATPTAIATATPTAMPTVVPTVSTGVGASLNGRLPFPADNAWNQTVDTLPVDSNSANLIASIGLTVGLHPDFGANWNGGPFGIPYILVGPETPLVPINFTDYGNESDPGPYPVPANAPIEGGPNASGDRHILVVDTTQWKLYELYNAYPQSNGSVNASSGAVFDLNSNAQRPAGWTSADAAGLPIFPGLVRYDEVVEQGEIRHALRFTVAHTRRGYVAPASHFASSNTSVNLPPMGMRVRLKASFDISTYPAEAQVILRALKKYGMILADNGSNWFISGAPDSRWNDTALNTLKQVKGSQFEVVQMGTVVTK